MTPACPRCGYDLTGLVGSWQDSCPLEAPCSECGLEIELRWVLNGRLRAEAEFFETAPYRPRQALVVTARRAVRPWVFWRWVRMEHEPRPGRMLAGAVLSLLLLEACIGAATALLVGLLRIFVELTRNYPYMSSVWRSLVMDVEGYLLPIGGGWLGEPDSSGALLVVALMAQLAMPWTFLLLPMTLRRARVRRVHLVRIWAWSYVGLPVAIVLVSAPSFVYSVVMQVASYIYPGPWAYNVQMRVYEIVHPREHLLLFGLVLAWTLLWWGFALGRYLKLPRAWLVAAVMEVLALVVAVLVSLATPLWYAVSLKL
jgi:hypothetical protein